MNIHETRRQNLQIIIDQDFDGNAAALARALGDQPSSIYRYFNEKESGRNIGAAKARDIEKAANRPAGFLDMPCENVIYESGDLDKRRLLDATRSVIFHLKASGKLEQAKPELIAERIVALYVSDGDMQKALDEIQNMRA